MDHEIVTLAERPDLMDVFWDMDTSWPEFMKLDAVLVALDASGRIVAKAFEVPGALAPVMCDAEHGTATYVEPNVWVRHATDV